ncbi:MAG TPA: serine/threonine-protein kinase [Kofleriaceae bacterium]|nr:serine/threonine-protein kinase [Kofleriaceae bacterium]
MTDGRVIDGRYVVEATLGQGGMGVVVRARHRFTGAHVALKMLHADLQFDQNVQDRFLAEARAPTTIGHPGIVQVLDAGKTPQGELYLVMELLEGQPLRRAMYQLPRAELVRIVLELLDALAAAHARGFVHRDLKPENVFLVGAAAKVKLLDFGIAKVVESSTRALGPFGTAAGMLLGTVAYMAPEQLADPSTVDARADLWAVGVLIYELLTHHLPYRGSHVSELMIALAQQEPAPITQYLPSASPALVQFFARALARDRDRRFGSARELAAAVSALSLDGASPVPPPPPLPVPARPNSGAPTVATAPPPTPEPRRAPTAAPARRGARHRLVLGIAIAAMLGITIAIVASGASGRSQEDAARAICTKGCAALSWCGMATGCQDSCLHDRRMQACLPDGATCDSFAVCYIGAVCEHPPSGSVTCRQAAECEGRCDADDEPCLCSCLAQLAPSQAAPLVNFNLCATTCPRGDYACLLEHCRPQATSCALP